MAGEGTGDGTGTGAGTGQEGLWRAQLPADLKENATFTPYKTLGDFAKAHLETVGKAADLDGKVVKMTELEAKLSGAIFKPDDKATPEQREAYLTALGRPAKPTEYAFPKTEGIERDPKFVEWAQNTFHKIGLSKEMGEQVAAHYDAFALEMANANKVVVEKAKTEAETKLKAELGANYPAAVELTKRFLTKHAKPEEMAFLDESGMGNHPAMIRMVVAFAKLTGEDISIQGAGPKGDASKPGMNYTTMGEFKGG